MHDHITLALPGTAFRLSWVVFDDEAVRIEVDEIGRVMRDARAPHKNVKIFVGLRLLKTSQRRHVDRMDLVAVSAKEQALDRFFLGVLKKIEETHQMRAARHGDFVCCVENERGGHTRNLHFKYVSILCISRSEGRPGCWREDID